MVEDINGYHVHLRDVYYTDITSGYAQNLVIENIWVRRNHDPLWKVDKHDATLISSLNSWTIPQIDCWTKLKSPLLSSWFHSPALSINPGFFLPPSHRKQVWGLGLPLDHDSALSSHSRSKTRCSFLKTSIGFLGTRIHQQPRWWDPKTLMSPNSYGGCVWCRWITPCIPCLATESAWTFSIGQPSQAESRNQGFRALSSVPFWWKSERETFFF